LVGGSHELRRGGGFVRGRTELAFIRQFVGAQDESFGVALAAVETGGDIRTDFSDLDIRPLLLEWTDAPRVVMRLAAGMEDVPGHHLKCNSGKKGEMGDQVSSHVRLYM